MSKLSMKATAVALVIGGAIASAVSASAALNLPTMSCSYSFNTNLRLGSRGTDVMNLQKVLNMYPQTMVASTGAGSPGMETSTFGPATRAAVNKFQALHLVELGITSPTGNVFAGTRGLLNQVCNGTVSTNPGNPTTPTQSGPVSVMLSGTQPTGQLVQTQSGARLADFTFSGNGTVTNLQLQRTGVSADTALANVYLYDGNTRITDAASVVTGGFINFNAPNGLFTVNGTRVLTVRADIAAGTSGQTVGVKLNSVTTLGGSASTFSNVMGNQLQIGSVTTATVNFSAITVANTTVDAGTTNYNVWSGVTSVGTRDVHFKAATFKFVGSAPVDALANLSLYVDGTKVAGPASINAMNNNKVTFDLGATPFLMKTGSHTIDVRADIVKGSNRTITMSVENVADLMFEDSNLNGVNVSATVANAVLTQSNSTYRTVTVNKGSVTVNVDSTFVANKVTGGATNVPVGQFTLKAYGEDVKVQTLNVAFPTATVPTLNNVSLYVNGGQVGTSQNLTSTSSILAYNLGSSMIIPANTTVTLTIKADIVNASNGAYTSGSIAARIGGVTGNAQGQSSNELTDVAASAVTGNVLTINSGSGTFSRTAGFTAVAVSPNTTGVKIGSFTLQADSSDSLKINSIGVNPVVAIYAQTNISNLTVKDGSTVVGTPVGNPSAGTTTFSFSDIILPANGTKTFDVYADIGGAASGTVTTGMDITYRGTTSNTTQVSAAAGVAITSTVSALGSIALGSQSPVSQFVVGGTSFGVATYNLRTLNQGTLANVRELRFTVASTGTGDPIESITVGGITAPVVNGIARITGLSLSIGFTGTDVPVTAKYSGFQSSTNGGSLQAAIASSTVALTFVEGTSGNGTVISTTSNILSNYMALVASKPTVTVGAGNVDTLILGAENKVGEVTVTADANGKISLTGFNVSLSAVGVSTSTFSSGRIADGNTTITGSAYNTGTGAVTFSPNYEISAGQSKTFSIYAVVNGTAQPSITPYVSSRLTSGASFQWNDVIGNNAAQTGAIIYNFPTSSFTTKR